MKKSTRTILKKIMQYKVIRCVFVFWANRNKKIIAERGRANEYKVSSLFQYAREHSCHMRIYSKRESQRVKVNHTFIPFEKNQDAKFGYVIKYPEYIAEIKDAIIVSESETVIKDDYYLNDRVDTYKECSIDFSASPGNFIISDVNYDYALVRRPAIDRFIDKGINMVGRWPKHIWHLSFEILSRLRILETECEYDSIPLIFDEAVFEDKRNVELIDLMNVRNYPIIILPKGESWQVNTLINIAFSTPEQKGYYLNQELSGSKICMKNIYLMPDMKTITLLRERVKKNYRHKGKKLFIVRKDNRLKNEAEVADYFCNFGFEIYDPEQLSFEEEVASFEEAEYIIGTVGGAFTNIIYCNSGTKVCIIGNEVQTDALLMAEAARHLDFDVYTICAQNTNRGTQVPGTILYCPAELCRNVAIDLGLVK